MSTPAIPVEQRPNVLEVRGLCISFGGVQAVNQCSFVVPEATALGLIGPNGAGKSTVIDLISGFKVADSGTAVFRGQELIRHETARHFEVGGHTDLPVTAGVGELVGPGQRPDRHARL